MSGRREKSEKEKQYENVLKQKFAERFKTACQKKFNKNENDEIGTKELFEIFKYVYPERAALYSNDKNSAVPTLRKWLNGESIPEYYALLRLCDTKCLDCSLDYLFGRIECTKHDVQFIHNYTGLSEESVEKLKHWNDLAHNPRRGFTWARNAIRAINDLFHCDIYFSHDVLNQIANYCYYRNIYENPNTKNKERTEALQRFQLALFNATNGLSDCIKDIFKEEKAPDTN